MIAARTLARVIPSAALLLALGGVCAYAVGPNAARLFAYLDGDLLRISSPELNFLNGKSAERLKDGGSVAFVAQISLATSPGALVPVARTAARFALSYDIWEEKFSVMRFGDSHGGRRAASHLTARGAESWCIDNLSLPRAQAPTDTPFWLQLDLRAEDPRDAAGVVGEPGINITRLIEVFSRPTRGSQPRWMLSAGPYNLNEMRHTDPARGDAPGPVKFDYKLEPKGPRG